MGYLVTGFCWQWLPIIFSELFGVIKHIRFSKEQRNKEQVDMLQHQDNKRLQLKVEVCSVEVEEVCSVDHNKRLSNNSHKVVSNHHPNH